MTLAHWGARDGTPAGIFHMKELCNRRDGAKAAPQFETDVQAVQRIGR